MSFTEWAVEGGIDHDTRRQQKKPEAVFLCSPNNPTGRLIPLPGEISAGCGLSWRILPEEYETYKDKIMSLDIPVEQTVEVRI